MTKLRAPLTFELALTKIAGLIGWDRAAAIVGAAERTVRNWSDPDTSSAVTLDAALQLDVEFRRAGGDGAPMLQCYATRLRVDTVAACPSSAAIARAAATAAKEAGEAIAAVIAAAQPGATPAETARAELELEESISAQTNTLATIRARRTGDVHPGAASGSAVGTASSVGEGN